MRKYLIILAISLFICSAIILSSDIIKHSGINATAVRPKVMDVEATVPCTGTVNVSSDSEVTADITIIPSEILIKEGETVLSGQTLIKVDKQATIDYIIENASGTAAQNREYCDELINTVPNEIVANVSGTIMSINAQQGVPAKKGETLLKILYDGAYTVTANISENHVFGVAYGQRVIINGNAMDNVTYYGTVAKVADKAKKTGSGSEITVECVINVNNPDALLKDGYTVHARIVKSVNKSALVVPFSATESDTSGIYVYKVQSGWLVKKYIKTSGACVLGYIVKKGCTKSDYIADDISNLNKDYIRVSAVVSK